MAFKPRKTYSLTMTGSSVRQALSAGGTGQVEISASGGDIVCKFGDAAVTASSTVTSQALPDGNFIVLSGQTKLYGLENETHIAMIGSAGVGYATVGHGEQI